MYVSERTLSRESPWDVRRPLSSPRKAAPVNNFVVSVLSMPPVVGAAYVLISCYGGMFGIARVVERRWLNPHKQYLAFILGNGLLAGAAATALVINAAVGLPPSGSWIYSGRWHLLVAVIFAAFGLWRWAFNDFPSYTVGQSASPTKLYHDTLFLAEGYFLFVLISPLIGRTWWFLAPFVFLGAWVYAGYLDGKTPWKAEYAHVDHDWAPKRWIERWVVPILGRFGVYPATP